MLNDLAFIKQHKRYPLGKRTVAPAALAGFLFLAAMRVVWPVLFITTTGNSSAQSGLAGWIIISVVGGFTIFMAVQAFRVLKFDKLDSPYHLAENMVLLKKFFTSNHLAFTQHPEAQEVFMIISRNLDASPKRDYREVMVFIADDKQILVNSHFTGKKFSITPPSRNYKRMSKELQRWLNDHINSNNNNIVPVTTF